jgi:hypothetical protein
MHKHGDALVVGIVSLPVVVVSGALVVLVGESKSKDTVESIDQIRPVIDMIAARKVSCIRVAIDGVFAIVPSCRIGNIIARLIKMRSRR